MDTRLGVPLVLELRPALPIGVQWWSTRAVVVVFGSVSTLVVAYYENDVVFKRVLGISINVS